MGYGWARLLVRTNMVDMSRRVRTAPYPTQIWAGFGTVQLVQINGDGLGRPAGPVFFFIWTNGATIWGVPLEMFLYPYY